MSFTVKEFIEYFSDCDPNAIVVISKDEEGNGFSPFYEASEEIYLPTSQWSGALFSDEDYRYENDLDDDEEYEKPEGLVNAVVLWPGN